MLWNTSELCADAPPRTQVLASVVVGALAALSTASASPADHVFASLLSSTTPVDTGAVGGWTAKIASPTGVASAWH